MPINSFDSVSIQTFSNLSTKQTSTYKHHKNATKRN